MNEETPDTSHEEGQPLPSPEQMWENLCLADELSEDCLALAEGLEAPLEAERRWRGPTSSPA